MSVEICRAFHWIGQPFSSCDQCGRPAWRHEGMAVLPEEAPPFGPPEWQLQPWMPGEAEAIRRKWEKS